MASNAGGTSSGQGIFKSTDAGTEFVHLCASPSSDIAWEYVYKIKPPQWRYLCGYTKLEKAQMVERHGLTLTDINIENFSNAYKNLEANDVDIHKDGKVIALVVGNRVLISKDEDKLTKLVRQVEICFNFWHFKNRRLDIAPAIKLFMLCG